MAGVLENLARGLRQAGGILSPDVAKTIAAEDVAKRADDRQVALAQLQERLRRESPEYQARVQAMENEKSFREAVAGAQGDMEKIAGAAVRYGKPELAINLYNQQEARAARLQQSSEALQTRRLQLEQNHQLSLQRITDSQARQAEIERHNRAMETLQSQNASLNAEIRRQSLLLQGIGVQLQRDRIDDQRRLREEKAETAESIAKAAVDNSSSNLDRLITEATQIKDSPALWRITGVTGALPNAPGSDAANVQARLETLKSQVAFSVLQAMRDASKTGGALGQVSERELAMLQNNLAALDTSQSPEAFKKSLQQIIDYAAGVKKRLKQAYDTTYGGGGEDDDPLGIR